MKKLKRPPAAELLNQAADLLNDGASQREVCRTTGLARETIRKYFPGRGWTYAEGGQFRQALKHTPLEKGITA